MTFDLSGLLQMEGFIEELCTLFWGLGFEREQIEKSGLAPTELKHGRAFIGICPAQSILKLMA